MFRLKSLTTFTLVLSLAFALLWSLLACASLCTLEISLHDSHAPTFAAIAGENSAGLEPVDDCCLCPDISSPSGTTQQRQTGEQIPVLKSTALCLLNNFEPYPISADGIVSAAADSPPKLHAPPLFVRLRSIRI